MAYSYKTLKKYVKNFIKEGTDYSYDELLEMIEESFNENIITGEQYDELLEMLSYEDY